MDEGGYRCLGCGWLVGENSKRIREVLFEDHTPRVPAHKLGEKPGD